MRALPPDPGTRRVSGWGLPSPCGICAAWAWPAGVCNDCLRRFAPPAHRCERCALRVPDGQTLCGRCLHSPPHFARAAAAVDYAFPWDRVIAEFKFRQHLGWAGPLARLMAERLGAEGPAVDLVTAVPLAAARLQSRGYNQAWEIAHRVAKRLHRPARHDLLLRLRDTPQQARLDHAERSSNLRGAFMPGDRAARQALAGRRVALVDDVLTTGATADEAARTLLEAGAREVDVWVLARTEREGP